MSSRPDRADVVILAGGPAMAAGGTTDAHVGRAMTPIGGKPMLQWVVDAMRRSRTIGRVYAVGDVSADGLEEVIPPAGDFVGNLLAGIARASENGAGSVLVATCDIPLVTHEAIDDFVAQAQALEADFCYPIVAKEDCARKYPGMRRTYLRLREGTFAGGNMVLISVDFALRNRDVIAGAYAARKNVFRLARLIGFGVLFRAILAQFVWPGAIDLPTLERTVSRLLNGKIRVVVTRYAEIGEDVDKPEDLAIVEKLLAVK